MNAAHAFEVVASAMGLIEYLSDEIEATIDSCDLDAIKSINADIWLVVSTIRAAVNGSSPWEEAERAIIAIRRRHEE